MTYFKKADGVLFVYDITDRETFEGIHKWVKLFDQNSAFTAAKVLIGNKTDREHHRDISQEEGIELALDYGMHFFEASAMTG